MKWYQKAGILLIVAVVAVVSGWLTHKLLYVPFAPTEVCAGEKNFAVAQNVNSSCYISLFNHEGYRIKKYHVGNINAEILRELCYSDGKYYAWMEDSDNEKMFVYLVGNKDAYVPVLHIPQNSNLCGMHVHSGLFSVISWKQKENHTECSVYLANKEKLTFSESYHFVLPLCAIRNAFYTSSDTIVYLTAEGNVFELPCYEESPEPVLLCQNTEEIFINMHEELCFLKSDGKLMCGKTTLFSEELEEQNLNLFSCMDINILENTYGAFLYQGTEQNTHVLFSVNGMTQDKTDVSFFGRWVSVVVFFLLFIIIGFCFLVVRYIFWYASQENVSLLFRIRLICITVAVVINILILHGSYQLYQNQQELQKWEQMSVVANNMMLYLENNTDVLSELSGRTEYNMEKLWAECPSFKELCEYTENIARRGEICTLFVPDAEKNLTAVSGKANQMFRSPERCFIAGIDSTYGMYQVDGVQWQYFSVPASSETSAVLIMQEQAKEEKYDNSELFYFSMMALTIGIAGFMIFLIRVLRRSIQPLSQMEQQAHAFMLKGDCEPVNVKGNTEVTLLASNFRQNVENLRISIRQQKENQKTFGKFVDEKWPSLFGKQKVASLHSGDTVSLPAAVLYMKIEPIENDNAGRRKIYEKILPVVRQHNGICEKLSMEHMRFVFIESSFDAICCASVIREILPEKCELKSVIYYSMMQFYVMGDETHKRVCTWHPEEAEILSKMKQVCQEYGCQILVTDDAMQNTQNFESVFNSRTIGFFQIETGTNSVKNIRLTEILSRKCADEFEQAVMLYQIKNYQSAFELFCAAMRKDNRDRAAVRYLQLCYQNLHEEREHST